MQKLQANLAPPGPVDRLAALVTTGAMNPMHAGHKLMLKQAAVRLEKEGFRVIAAYASPSHDGYVQPKARSLGVLGLSADFRKEVARLTVEDDDLVEMASWEADYKGHWPDFPDVARNLDETLRRGLQHPVQVFFVCGTDLFEKCGLCGGLGGIGVVVVPRSGDQVPRELPSRKVFVAEQASAAIGKLSSTKVREALAKGDTAYLEASLPPQVAKLLLEPTQDQMASFSRDLESMQSQNGCKRRKRQRSGA